MGMMEMFFWVDGTGCLWDTGWEGHGAAAGLVVFK